MSLPAKNHDQWHQSLSYTAVNTTHCSAIFDQ